MGMDVLQTGVVRRALGKHLVLDVDAADAGPLEGAHGVHGVNRVAIAGAGVADDGQGDRLGDALGNVNLLGQRHQRLGDGQMGAAHITRPRTRCQSPGIERRGRTWGS